MDGPPGIRDHLAAATWHLGRAATLDDAGPDLAADALRYAERLGAHVSPAPGEDPAAPRDLLWRVVRRPEPPFPSSDLAVRTDQALTAMEILHTRLEAAGFAASDEGRWDTLVDALGLSLSHQRQLQRALRNQIQGGEGGGARAAP